MRTFFRLYATAFVVLSVLSVASCKQHAHWQPGRCLASHTDMIPVVGIDGEGNVTTHFAFNEVCDMRAPATCELGDYGETSCPTR